MLSSGPFLKNAPTEIRTIGENNQYSMETPDFILEVYPILNAYHQLIKSCGQFYPRVITFSTACSIFHAGVLDGSYLEFTPTLAS